MVAPGSIAFPPLVATREWEHDRPAIGQIYQSVGGDERRTELNSTAPVIAAHEEECRDRPETGDYSISCSPTHLPHVVPRCSDFVRYGSVSLISTTARTGDSGRSHRRSRVSGHMGERHCDSDRDDTLIRAQPKVGVGTEW